LRFDLLLAVATQPEPFISDRDLAALRGALFFVERPDCVTVARVVRISQTRVLVDVDDVLVDYALLDFAQAVYDA
jgi:hypothetical protein